MGSSNTLNFYKLPAQQEPVHVTAQHEALAVFQQWVHTAQRQQAATDARTGPDAADWEVRCMPGLVDERQMSGCMRSLCSTLQACVLAVCRATATRGWSGCVRASALKTATRCCCRLACPPPFQSTQMRLWRKWPSAWVQGAAVQLLAGCHAADTLLVALCAGCGASGS